MLTWLKQHILARETISPKRWQKLISARPALNRLAPEAQTRLQVLAARILADKDFVGGAGFEPEPNDRLTVSLLAALPVLELDLDWYRDFETFILYPGAFVADVKEIDEAGVMHSGRDLRAGEAWRRGPVVLSLKDIAASGLGNGYNVVVHELAHQMDQRNGKANGFPVLHRGMSQAEWTRAFSTGFERLKAQLEAGEKPWLDPYGAENPAEFFAVCCEYFFDVPAHLAEADPPIYGQLARFFRQDPLG